MANEITLQAGLTLIRTTQLENYQTGAVSLNQAGSRLVKEIITIPTTALALGLSTALGTIGYVLIQSLDTSTNGLLYLLTTTGSTTGAAVAILSAGDVHLSKIGPGMQNISMIAGSTATQVRVVGFEL